VKSVFLHGDPSEEIFMEQPLCFVTYSTLVFLLKKYIYGLKSTPRSWYATIDYFFLQIGFKHCEYDHILYVPHTNGDILIIVVYVDDLLITGNNNYLILRLKKQLVDSFDMIDFNTLHYFLGLQLLPLCDGFFISQSKYVMVILTHFKMDDCNLYDAPFQSGVNLTKTCQTPKIDATLYRQLVGSLIYLTHIQLGISFVVSVVSWFMQDPRESH
jgi:hypothetical protein